MTLVVVTHGPWSVEGDLRPDTMRPLLLDADGDRLAAARIAAGFREGRQNNAFTRQDLICDAVRVAGAQGLAPHVSDGATVVVHVNGSSGGGRWVTAAASICLPNGMRVNGMGVALGAARSDRPERSECVLVVDGSQMLLTLPGNLGDLVEMHRQKLRSGALADSGIAGSDDEGMSAALVARTVRNNAAACVEENDTLAGAVGYCLAGSSADLLADVARGGFRMVFEVMCDGPAYGVRWRMADGVAA